MFRHQGKTRTATHNLQIASLLSFVAGIINITGFESINKLTTNVTGHFAYMINGLFKLNFFASFIFFTYIFFFFFGSFVSNFLIEIVSRKNVTNVYFFPVIIEIIILFLIPFSGTIFVLHHTNIIACCLLFAMGLQNSLVTKISNATVRTTHLTGLFTDLGIEISQLFFYKSIEKRNKLLVSIKLRCTIIGFFFIGGIFGGYFYHKIGLNVLYISGFILILGLLFDNMKLKIILLSRKLRIVHSVFS
jgi:uncharacterized membrane protein YoaK (UPF0700 family)